MRTAIGIIGVLLVIILIYYFLPSGLKTTVRAIFGGSNTTVSQRASATPAALPTNTAKVEVKPTATPLATLSARATATPSARATASATPRAATSSSLTNLPGTGFSNQPPELIAIEILASALLLLVGIRLSRHA